MSTPTHVPSVGQSIPRVDGAPKVLGTALYVDDLPRRPGELFGATVRSSVARGILRAIRFDPSFDWSAVTVVTAKDVPENLVAMIAEDQPVLAESHINHAYEPVVLLAASDKEHLERAVRAVTLDVDPLPPALDLHAALDVATSGVVWTPRLPFGEPGTNIMKRYLIEKGEADIAARLASCEVVVRGTYSTHHQEQMYIEPQGVVAYWDDAGVHAIGSIQCPYYVAKAFARGLALSNDQIHVTQAVTGGGFGGKEEYPSVIALHAALLAKKSGRPVRMVYGRTEDIEATTKRHPCALEIATGCDRDGTLRALDMRVIMDGGAYVTLTPVVLSRGALHAAGAYRWPSVRIEALAVATNTPPNGAFRGFGAPQTIFGIERHMDRVAAALGREPMDLRRQNVLREGDTTATGQVLRTSVAGIECLDKAMAASGYEEKRARYPLKIGRKVRGIGGSLFMHGAGFTGSGERYLKGKVAIDLTSGGGLLIRTASTDIGQGTETVFRQIAADAAGIVTSAIDFAVPSTSTVPDSGPTVASRTVMVVGSIVEAAAREVAGLVREEQARGGGSFGEAGDRLLAKGSVTSLKQYEPPSFIEWDDVAYKGDAYPCYGWMCDIVEVEVDLDTFEVAVVEATLAGDVGKAINPIMCKGQLEGGTLQAFGWALSEDVRWKDGRITNPRFTNYIIPTALDAPRFHTILVEAPFAFGPAGGAKGIGELPMDGGAPAVCAAIEHAITGGRVVLNHLPVLPERVFETMKASPGELEHLHALARDLAESLPSAIQKESRLP